MTSTTPTIDLETRLRDLEDRFEILQLVAAYGPVADSGSGDVAERMWLADGWYDSGIERFDGAAAVGDMLNSLPLHLELMAGGCTHLNTVPVVNVQGDHATAVCHGQLLRREGDQFVVWRSGAVRWELVRTADGWRIASRQNHLLDGSAPAQELFRSAVRGVAEVES